MSAVNKGGDLPLMQGVKFIMSTQKFYIVTELSRTDCGYEYIEYFNTKEEAQAFIDEHQAEYGGILAIVESQR